MFRSVALVILFFAKMPSTMAAPYIVYQPATGGFWISGTQQLDGYGGLFLYSESGQLAEPNTQLLVGYPLDNDPHSPTYLRWLHTEISLSLPINYIDRLFLGTFAKPDTPALDWTARYVWISFARRQSVDQPIPVYVAPEPNTAWLVVMGVGFALWIKRRNRK